MQTIAKSVGALALLGIVVCFCADARFSPVAVRAADDEVGVAAQLRIELNPLSYKEFSAELQETMREAVTARLELCNWREIEVEIGDEFACLLTGKGFELLTARERKRLIAVMKSQFPVELRLLAETDADGVKLDVEQYASVTEEDDLPQWKGVEWFDLERAESLMIDDTTVVKFAPCETQERQRVVFASDAFESWKISYDMTGAQALGFEMTVERGKAFKEFTRDYVERRLAILVLGRLNSAPIIMSPIEGSGIITGYSKEALALLLKTMYPLPVKSIAPER